MKRIFRKILDFLFPDSCILCELELNQCEEFICSSCYVLLNPFEPDIYESHKKFLGKINIKDISAMYIYSKDSYVQNIMHSIKYKGNSKLAVILGEEYASKNTLKGIDLITPVPLHSKRFRKRGYNQSMEWAKGISDKSGILALEVLKRTKETKTQTKQSRFERWKNVEDSFSIMEPDQIKGKTILLVDDVITTGSTIEACANELIKHGAREVKVAAIGIAY